jgi:uncharacterized protein YbcV (DUF1398 family)
MKNKQNAINSSKNSKKKKYNFCKYCGTFTKDTVKQWCTNLHHEFNKKHYKGDKN